MSDLRFTTSGQQEVLAAQEALRKKALETRQEYEAGAKATQTWDANVAAMQRTSESALRSVRTEQEKIVDQITAIQEAVENGLYDGREEEAEKALTRLRQKWIDVDSATLKAKEQTRLYEQEQQQLKDAAVSALEGVKTEYEEIEEQIADIERAAAEGLVPPEEAEAGVARLKDRLAELDAPIAAAGDKFDTLVKKINDSFDPTNFKNIKQLAGLLGVPLGIGGAISLINSSLEEMEKRAAAAREFAVQEKSSEIEFARAGLMTGQSGEALRQALADALQIAAENAIPAEYVRGAIATAIGQGQSPSEAAATVRRLAPTYFDDPQQLAQAVANWLDPERRPQWTPSQEELFRVTGGLDPVARLTRIRQIREQFQRTQANQTAGGLTAEEAETLTDLIRGAGLNATRGVILNAFRAGDTPEQTRQRLEEMIRAIEGAEPGGGGSRIFPSPSVGPLPPGSREAQEMLQWLRAIAASMENIDNKTDPTAGGIGP